MRLILFIAVMTMAGCEMTKPLAVKDKALYHR